MEKKLTGFLFIVALISSLNATAQNIIWELPYDSAGAFSSPKLLDLNQDGIDDVLIGGGFENNSSKNGLLALNGLNGQVLWRLRTRNQIYSTPRWTNINSDNIPDIIFCGRDALLYALDGVNGNVIWEFYPDSLPPAAQQGLYNFYTPSIANDVNNDGVDDIIIMNGGDASALAGDTTRPAGKLMLISGLDGQVIQADSTPDGKESYFAAMIYPELVNGETMILFGSGGETVRGKLWKVGLNDFLVNGNANATAITSDNNKGFIANISFADMNLDGTNDILVPGMGGYLRAIDVNGQQIWEVQLNNCENYTAPALGNLNGDAFPDVVAVFANGVWPFYSRFIRVFIDGQNGQVIYQDTLSGPHLASPNILDWDRDGIDEVLFINNEDVGFATVIYQNKWEIIDVNNNNKTFLPPLRNGTSVFPTSQIKDMDNDGNLDMVYVYNDDRDGWYGFDFMRVGRASLNFGLNHIAWAGNFGTQNDGTYVHQYTTQMESLKENKPYKIYPNPTQGGLFVDGKDVEGIKLYDLNGRQILETKNSRNVDMQDFQPGMYILEVQGAEKSTQFKVILN